jgi:hypothetical protein
LAFEYNSSFALDLFDLAISDLLASARYVSYAFYISEDGLPHYALSSPPLSLDPIFEKELRDQCLVVPLPSQIFCVAQPSSLLSFSSD